MSQIDLSLSIYCIAKRLEADTPHRWALLRHTRLPSLDFDLCVFDDNDF
jgi:hypothetical protein